PFPCCFTHTGFMLGLQTCHTSICLRAFAKDVDLSKIKCGTINSSFEKFFTKLYSDYKKKTDYMNDLKFSAYTCNSVINYILDSILSNTIKSYHIANCG
ncbi:MAG: hypothetical protein E6X57_15255, partial [Clostridioides difficile]|nr:hypothetical protein [Clostridioides difficile]